MSEALSAAPSRGRVASLRFAGDDRLARLAAAGDPAAFAAIYRRYHRDLGRYCQAILGSPEQAEDALQNTMVSAMRALPGETREIALKPWLYRVAHNEAISILRQRRSFEEIDPELAEPESDPHPRAEAREGLATLLRDLEALPERQRGALVMRELNDFSYAEIADSLDFSEGAARQAIYEARRSLLEMSEGRQMECATVRSEISENDKRVLRGRRLRAHLRDCGDCREFEAAIKGRRAEFAQIAPLAPAAAAAILQSVLGSSAGGGGGALGAAAGAGGALGGSTAVKSAVAVVAIAAAGAGAADLAGVVDLNGSGAGGSATSTESDEAARGESGKAAAGGHGTGEGAKDGSASGSGGGKGQGAKGNGNAGKGKGNGKGHGKGPGNGPGKGQGNGHGQGDGGGVGVGAGGTPPGQGGTVPGQAATPPGQAGPSSAAAQNPNGSPPGQTLTPPGQGGTAPGQAQTTPGQSGTAGANTDGAQSVDSQLLDDTE